MQTMILQREIVTHKVASKVLGVSFFMICTALGAFVRIPLPFTPVPLTLQTFFVLLSGACLGGNLGATSQLGYLLIGLAGLPVFANAGSGLAYLLGPTAGYLFGFIFASFFSGRLIKYREDNLFWVILSLFCADLILLCSGVFWLKLLFGYTLKKLLFIGFFPFLPGDLLKVIAAAWIFARIKSRLKAIF